MAAKKRGLGERGLGALLAGSLSQHNGPEKGTGSTSEDGELRELPVELVQRGQYQPRRDMDPAALEELADSIRRQGVMQPIVVRPIGEGRDRKSVVQGKRDNIGGARATWKANRVERCST